MAKRDDDSRTVLVWDAPTRLFHWLVVGLVLAAYVTFRLRWMGWHEGIGYTLLALVFFRVLWGFFGSETARFVGLLASPRGAAHHLLHLFHREPDRQVGHNPAGGWMVLLLLGLLLGECLTGLYLNNDIANEGPLTELVPASVANLIDALHTILWQALLAAMALHILAILIYAAVKRQNLVLPMFSGRKALPAGTRSPALAGAARALLL
ncbi:MAG: cytochrome b/b6 domain-containing protein, partial [Bradyrhizobium sp.]